MIRTRLLGAGAALLLSAGTALAAPAVARSDLNVRSGPGTEHAKVGVIQGGETVDVVGRNGSWCQVEFGGGSGFASCSYLQMAGGAPSGPVVVEAPAYDPYDYYDYGYSYGPSVGIYAGPRYRYGWRGRSAWQGRGDWQGRGNWQGRGDFQGRPGWQGGGNRMGNVGRGPERSGMGMGRPGGGAPQASAPAGMPRGGAGPRMGGGAPGGGGVITRGGVR